MSDLVNQTDANVQDEDAPPIDLPATFMGPQDAETLRKYQGWLEREKLSAQLECASCGGVCKTFVTSGDIGIFCECRVLVSKVS